MFILPNRSAEVYKRIKKNCECRFGVMSQCVLAANVLKNQAQYHSNVCMKFNAKLGGTTCRIKLVSNRHTFAGDDTNSSAAECFQSFQSANYDHWR